MLRIYDSKTKKTHRKNSPAKVAPWPQCLDPSIACANLHTENAALNSVSLDVSLDADAKINYKFDDDINYDKKGFIPVVFRIFTVILRFFGMHLHMNASGHCPVPCACTALAILLATITCLAQFGISVFFTFHLVYSYQVGDSNLVIPLATIITYSVSTLLVHIILLFKQTKLQVLLRALHLNAPQIVAKYSDKELKRNAGKWTVKMLLATVMFMTVYAVQAFCFNLATGNQTRQPGFDNDTAKTINFAFEWAPNTTQATFALIENYLLYAWVYFIHVFNLYTMCLFVYTSQMVSYFLHKLPSVADVITSRHREMALRAFRKRHHMICSLVGDADSIFSPVIFIWYAAELVTTLLIISSMRNTDWFSQWYLGFELCCILATSIFCFVVVSINAEHVNNKIITSLRPLRELDDIQSMASAHMTVGNLNYLINLIASPVSFTGWGFFSISRGFMLTIFGTLMTYSMFLYGM